MATARTVRQGKRPYGLWLKMTAVTLLGLCFIFVWSVFSSPSSSVTTQRQSFDDIAEPVSTTFKENTSGVQAKKTKPEKKEGTSKVGNSSRDKFHTDDMNRKKMNESASVPKERNRKAGTRVHKKQHKEIKEKQNQESESSDGKELEENSEEEGDGKEVEVEEQGLDRDSEMDVDVDADGGTELADPDSEAVEDGSVEPKKPTKRKIKGPLFDPKASYRWKLCSTRSKHNYIPCIDIEVASGKLQSYRHTERSCPRTPLMCLVPLPHEGYGSPVPWPESKSKVYEKLEMVNVDC